jgi:hypothetical protein
MDGPTVQFVRQRAGHRCEYCHLPQELSGLRFHVEHIVARKHRGPDDAENLALACPECNCHKGTNLSGIDPDTGKMTALFHPRRDHWGDHFAILDGSIIGKTPEGRTTAWLLEMNSHDRLRIRQQWGGLLS